MYSDEILKRKGGLFSIRVELAKAFDAEDPSQEEGYEMMMQDNRESHYIVLREFTSGEMIELQGLEQSDMIRELEKKLDLYIVDHSFKKSDGGQTPSGDVKKIITMSSSLLVYVLNTWQSSLPLAKRMLKASVGQ